MESALSSVLRVTQTQQNHNRRSISPAIETNIEGNTAAMRVKIYLGILKLEILPYPRYLSDNAPSDYYLFRSMHMVYSNTSILMMMLKNGGFLESLKRPVMNSTARKLAKRSY